MTRPPCLGRFQVKGRYGTSGDAMEMARKEFQGSKGSAGGCKEMDAHGSREMHSAGGHSEWAGGICKREGAQRWRAVSVLTTILVSLGSIGRT